MRTYLLDKVISVATDYTAEMDKAYVIEEVGTTSAGTATFKVAGAPCLEIASTFGRDFPIPDNLNTLLPLGSYFIVVPPTKKFRFDGNAGSVMRLKGKIIELEPGEALPASFLGRYTEQSKKFISYKTGSVSLAAGATWTAGTESLIINFTCPAGEKWLFNSRYQAEARLDDLTPVASGYSQIRINDDPLDILDTAMGKKGIAGSAAPNPPRHTQAVEKIAKTLEEMPIELNPGVNLKVYLINTGADYAVPTGRTLYLNVDLIGIKEYI